MFRTGRTCQPRFQVVTQVLRRLGFVSESGVHTPDRLHNLLADLGMHDFAGLPCLALARLDFTERPKRTRGRATVYIGPTLTTNFGPSNSSFITT